MANRASSDCVIVGGGMGGAVLALALGRRGYRVSLLEREQTPPGVARPEILTKSTMEVFERLGVGQRMRREAAIPLQGLQLYRPGNAPLLHFTRKDFDRSGTQPYSTDPARTRQILLDTAAAHGSVELLRGVEVRELLRENGRVTGVRGHYKNENTDWHARLVVGDDGGKSLIRTALGIALRTKEFAADFLAAVGPALPGHREAIGETCIDPARARDGLIGGIFMPLPEQRTAVVFPLSPAALTHFQQVPPAEFYAAATRLSSRCENLAQYHRFPEGFGHFRRPFGHASRYVDDGAAILGDAAHPVTPAGGQGANMSVADAMALADVAADALSRNDCSAKRLAAYEAARRPANERSLQFSVHAHQALRTLAFAPWLAPVLLWYLSTIDHSPRNKERFLRAISQGQSE